MSQHDEHAAAITLRPAGAADAAAIAAIWWDGWRAGHLGHVPAALVAARTRESFDVRAAQRVGPDAPHVLVSEREDRLTGFVMVAGDEVEQVYVAAAARGTGVAGLLLAEAEGLVAAGGHDRAWLAVAAGNARARRFYARQGWTDEGAFDYPAPGPEGPIPVPCHRYAKLLAATPGPA